METPLLFTFSLCGKKAKFDNIPHLTAANSSLLPSAKSIAVRDGGGCSPSPPTSPNSTRACRFMSVMLLAVMKRAHSAQRTAHSARPRKPI